MGYQFYQDSDANYRVQVALGGVPAGLGDVGEILTAVGQAGQGDDKSWSAAFKALGSRVEKLIDEALSVNDTRSARDAALRAAAYYASALEADQSFADEGTIRDTFHAHRRCWERFADLTSPKLERVDIPYEDTTMPGYFLSVDGTPRPTVVFINGSDGALTWVWQEMLAAYERGFNGLIFDGPGQQSMLFDRGIGFRPDWEAVITPVVDFIVQRPDVAADALVLWAGSQGGYWAPRALAFEKRFAAAFLDPGVVDVSDSWLRHFPPEMTQLLVNNDKETFNTYMTEGLKSPELRATWDFRARPYRQDNPYDVCKAMMQYNVTDVAGQITTPTMIADPEGEQFWPGQSEQLATLIGDPAVVVKFTADEGADMHCEPVARSLVQQRMYGWLAGVLPTSARG